MESPSRTQIKPVALSIGKLLIAEPFLADANFARTVVLLCEHGDEGSVGFVLNKATSLTLGDLLPDVYTPLLSVHQGGPVQLDTLHMLHRSPGKYGGTNITADIFWGGSYDSLQSSIRDNTYQPIDLRLFVGYSGWSTGQLEKEVAEGSWLITDVTPSLLFETDPENIWRRSLELMGDKYANLANLPVNPQLN